MYYRAREKPKLKQLQCEIIKGAKAEVRANSIFSKLGMSPACQWIVGVICAEFHFECSMRCLHPDGSAGTTQAHSRVPFLVKFLYVSFIAVQMGRSA